MATASRNFLSSLDHLFEDFVRQKDLREQIRSFFPGTRDGSADRRHSGSRGPDIGERSLRGRQRANVNGIVEHESLVHGHPYLPHEFGGGEQSVLHVVHVILNGGHLLADIIELLHRLVEAMRHLHLYHLHELRVRPTHDYNWLGILGELFIFQLSFPFWLSYAQVSGKDVLPE
eukprot:CAMPEP_0194526126 /NCGR_PEP_ID=MMETSP0253-20130528/61862_1 /TAXON_ID=2966 /ORGANISM="Noctiluca scintillans" /LENGTH=173 /DNA_ID=CAMNT_0039370925 /DNA_START=289 /DNA_END=811 /DNA_ORIENTATION=+